MTDYKFDLFVIGGGSGGVRAARVASSNGLTVGLAEGWDLEVHVLIEVVFLKNYTPMHLIFVMILI